MGMFDPKPVAPATTALKPAKSNHKEQVPIAGVEKLAMIDVLQKALKGIKGTYETDVKDTALTHFMAQIKATGQRPETFAATEGSASANLTLRRKAETELTDEQVALLRSNQLEPVEVETTPELFFLNPAYASDKVLLKKVEKALGKIVPSDFFEYQPRKTMHVATEETLLEAIRRKLPQEVISMLTIVACSPKIVTINMATIIDFVRDVLTPAKPDGKKIKKVAA